MSKDPYAYGGWQKGACLSFLLFIVNLVVFANWYLSFWDLSSDTYRPLVILDFVIVPGTILGSILIIWACEKFVRD